MPAQSTYVGVVVSKGKTRYLFSNANRHREGTVQKHQEFLDETSAIPSVSMKASTQNFWGKKIRSQFRRNGKRTFSVEGFLPKDAYRSLVYGTGARTFNLHGKSDDLIFTHNYTEKGDRK